MDDKQYTRLGFEHIKACKVCFGCGKLGNYKRVIKMRPYFEPNPEDDGYTDICDECAEKC